MADDALARQRVDLAVRRQRADSWYNSRNRFGGPADPVIRSSYRKWRRHLDRYEAEAIYTHDWISARIVDKLADDATRKWIEFHHDTDPDKADKLRQEDQRLNGRGLFNDGIKWARLFGGSLLIMGAWDTGDPEEPLDVEKVKKVMFNHVVDRWLAFPARWYSDPEEGLFGSPEIYRAVRLSPTGSPMAHVHETRVIRFEGISYAPLTRIRNWTWGQSVLDKVYDELRRWGISVQALSAVLPAFITKSVKIENLKQLLASGQFEEIQLRLNEIAAQMAINNLTFYGEGESIESHTTQLGGLPDVVTQLMKIVSAAADIPMSILFQAETGSLGGNAATTDRDNWFNTIENYQEIELRPRIRRWLDVIGVPLGIKPGEVEFSFRPLKHLSDTEKAELYLKIMQGDQVAVNLGMVEPERLAVFRFGGGEFNTNLPVVNTERLEKIVELMDKEPPELPMNMLQESMMREQIEGGGQPGGGGGEEEEPGGQEGFDEEGNPDAGEGEQG